METDEKMGMEDGSRWTGDGGRWQVAGGRWTGAVDGGRFQTDVRCVLGQPFEVRLRCRFNALRTLMFGKNQ